jgi:hypothetical protein
VQAVSLCDVVSPKARWWQRCCGSGTLKNEREMHNRQEYPTKVGTKEEYLLGGKTPSTKPVEGKK